MKKIIDGKSNLEPKEKKDKALFSDSRQNYFLRV